MTLNELVRAFELALDDYVENHDKVTPAEFIKAQSEFYKVVFQLIERDDLDSEDK